MYHLLIFYRVVLFVCFFKQKTAYEMRISDWSSDVCSSDLPALKKPHAIALVPGVGSGMETVYLFAVLAEVHVHQRIPYTCLPIAVAPDYLPGQIGRESCRERVCQYV